MGRKLNDKLPNSATELEGITKAAILLMTLETDAARTLLKKLTPEQVEDVTRELAGLGRVPDPLRDQVVEEFYALSVATEYLSEGGLDYAKVLIKESLDPSIADRVIQQIQTQVQKTPFSFCRRPRARTC